jgi:ABC-type uncharacterized transport system permease subunit
MAREHHGIELVRYCVDWVRGLGGLGFIAIAAIYAGGWQGWVLGVALLVFAVALGSWWWLRRDRDRRLPN